MASQDPFAQALDHPMADPQRREGARTYARRRRALFALELVLSGAALAGLLLTGLSIRLRDTLASHTPPTTGDYGALVAYVGLLLPLWSVLLLPLAYYGGFILPHRFHLSVQTRRGWAADYVKGMVLGLLQAVIVAVAVYALLQHAPTWWWLWAGLCLAVFGVVLVKLAPVLIMPLFFKLRPLADEDLRHRLERLATAAGARVGGVWVMDMSRRTRAANAMLMGLGNTRRIVLGDTLWPSFDAEEVETVLAHELGHHIHHDLWRGLALDGAITLWSLWVIDRLARSLTALLGLNGLADVAALPLWLLVVGAVFLLALPVTNAFSRHREAAADRFAVGATGNVAAWKRALRKLADQNLAEVDPPRWVEWLLYSHPSVRHRLEAADRALQA